MIRPLLNEYEREIIRDVDSCYRAQLVFYIARLKLKRQILRDPYVVAMLQHFKKFISRWN